MTDYTIQATSTQKKTFIKLVPMSAGGSGSAGAGAAGRKGQAPITCPFQVVGYGFDTLHISLDVDCKNIGLLARMETAKKSLQSTSTATEGVFQFTESGTAFNWNLQRSGTKMYPYIFRSGDLSMGISNRKAGSQIPNMQLKIGSISCNEDLDNLMRMWRFWLSCVGISILEEKATRVDICADISHDIKRGMLDRQSRYITQARNVSLHYTNRKFTGITFGRGQVVCRIYDKITEMNEKKALEKSMFFHQKWGAAQGAIAVTRVEFQLRREVIKEFFKGKTDVAVLMSRKDQLWKYCTEKWLRHCSSFVDRENKNHQRCQNSYFWQAVCSAPARGSAPIVRRRSRIHVNILALRKQASGILTTICAAVGLPSSARWDIMSTCVEIVTEDIKERMKEPGFPELFLTKQVRALACF